MTASVIGISLGHLSSFEAGLGEFAHRLGEGLAKRSATFRENKLRLCFHMPEHLHGAFGPEVDYIAYRSRQRFAPWRLDGCVLWHNTFQHNITRPPMAVRHRMVTVHDLNYRYVRAGPGSWRDSLLTRIAIARSNCLVSISDYVGEDVRRHVTARGRRLTIHNGATDLSHAPQRAVDEFAGRRFFFHLSRMAPSKNVRSLIELARSWPERTFVLAGPAWGHSQQLHDELGDSLPNVHVLLGIDESAKAWLLAHCEAFLFPSLAEGFGLPPLEAMYFGAPVFLSRLTSLPEIGGSQAAYFDDFSPQSMRATIEHELPRLQALRDDIRRRAQQFDWNACVSRYAQLYGELSSGPMPRGRRAA
jgi:glycosyltransferase involved in cell wall biosynthesis